MLKSALAVLAFAVIGAAAVPASADTTVKVDVNGIRHHHRHLAEVVSEPRYKHHHVYYSGAYAYVARADGATIVHAYPGVDVFVGAGGGVNVNVGY